MLTARQTLRQIIGRCGVGRIRLKRALQLASRLGVSHAVIGLSVFALGTSLPELATTLLAALHRHSDVALGNVLGSNVANIGLIMGLVSLVYPMRVNWMDIRRDVFFMSAATVLAVAAVLTSRLDALTGAVLWAVLLVSLWFGIRKLSDVFISPRPHRIKVLEGVAERID